MNIFYFNDYFNSPYEEQIYVRESMRHVSFPSLILLCSLLRIISQQQTSISTSERWGPRALRSCLFLLIFGSNVVRCSFVTSFLFVLERHVFGEFGDYMRLSQCR